MSDLNRPSEVARHGTGRLPPDFTEDELAAAPALASVDALLIRDLTSKEDDLFAESLKAAREL